MIEFTNNFRKVIEDLHKRSKVVDALRNGLSEGLRQYETLVIKDQLSGRRSGNYGLNRVSGHASSSLNTEVKAESNDIVGRLTVDKSAWYLKVHQHEDFKGTIKTKNKEWLTIPAIPGAVGRRASDFNLVFIMPKSRRPFLLGKGDDTKRGVIFRLVKQVYIPKRLYFYETYKSRGAKMIIDRIGINLRKVIQK